MALVLLAATSATIGWNLLGRPSATLGSALAGGDVDGDGYADVLIGAPLTGVGGEVRVYQGSATGIGTTATVLEATVPGEGFGSWLASGMDVNGDGFDDALVATDFAHSRVYVFHGSALGIATTPAVDFDPGDIFSAPIAAGDIDGDGYDEVAFAVCQGAQYDGKAKVYWGSAGGLRSSDKTAIAPAVGARCNLHLQLAAGDVNGDGYADLAASARGEALVYHGSAAGLVTPKALRLTGSYADCYGCGITLADTTGDGYDDLLIGAHFARYERGRIYVHPGSAQGIAATPIKTVTGVYGNQHFGYAMLRAGDLNADGHEDLLVAERHFSGDYADEVRMCAGTAAGFDGSQSNTIVLYDAGFAVASAGDVDGNGKADTLVEHPGGFGGAGLHMVQYWQFSTGSHPHWQAASWSGQDEGPLQAMVHVGWIVRGLGDLNGDGYDELLVSGLGDSLYLEGEGDTAYILAGSPTGPDPTPMRVLYGDVPENFYLNGQWMTTSSGTFWVSSFGSLVKPAGDINGDGYDDVLVGTVDDILVQVYAGGPNGLSDTPFDTLQVLVKSFGTALDAAGDVNGDGYDDVIVGAPEFHDWKGRAYVFHGSPTGFGNWQDTTITGGTAAYDGLGYQVSGAGDVDADGYDDVLVTAWGNGTSRVELHLGSANGVSTTHDAQLAGVAGERFGRWLAKVGDVNADGYGDVAVVHSEYGHLEEDDQTCPVEGVCNRGRISIFHGSSAGLGTSAATVIDGASGGAELSSVVGVGDYDADGYDDVLVGSMYEGFEFHRGSASGVRTTVAVSWTGEQMGGVGAADANGDGVIDAFAGQTGANRGGGWVFELLP